MVEIDEIEKRLEWLDSERQKDKKLIVDLQHSIEDLQSVLQKQNADVKKVELTAKSFSPLPSRIESIGEEISAFKTDLSKKITDLEKSTSSAGKKVEKSQKEDVNQLLKRLDEIQLEIKPFYELKKTLQTRVEEEFRINQKVENVANGISELRTLLEETQHQISLTQAERNQESKRITDLQLETSAFKNRIEEVRNFIDLDKEALRKVDKKIDDLLATEKERKKTQSAFLEKVSLEQVEKNAQWKDWQQKNDELKSLGASINDKMLEFNEAIRTINKAQNEFEGVNDRINRRINEITEMNRLSDERFRQEWIAFKAEDQKRWTNYTLTREEESREDARLLSQVNDRLVKIEDTIQDLQDTMALLTDELKKQINGFYSATQEMVESFTQTFRKR
jgi:chromosome segregation ATPase